MYAQTPVSPHAYQQIGSSWAGSVALLDSTFSVQLISLAVQLKDLQSSYETKSTSDVPAALRWR